MTRTFTAAHRAPVLLVRLRSASVQSPRPSAGPGAAEAIDTKSVWSEPTMTLLVGSALLDYLGPLGGRQSCQRTTRLWQGGCSVRAIAAAADLGIWHLGEVLAAQRRRHVYPISIAGAQLASRLIVTSPPMGGRTHRRNRSTAGPARSARHLAKCSMFLFGVAGCLQDDAPVRRASRLRTTSGGARCAR